MLCILIVSYIVDHHNTSKQSCNGIRQRTSKGPSASGQSPLTKRLFDTLDKVDTTQGLINALCCCVPLRSALTALHCSTCEELTFVCVFDACFATVCACSLACHFCLVQKLNPRVLAFVLSPLCVAQSTTTGKYFTGVNFKKARYKDRTRNILAQACIRKSPTTLALAFFGHVCNSILFKGVEVQKKQPHFLYG